MFKAIKNNKLFVLISSMFQIGMIGFGGGNALVPVMENIATNKKLSSKEDFDIDVVVANLTPGALPVEIACSIGKRIGGYFGMILSAISISLPGVALSLLFYFFTISANSFISNQIIFCSFGIFAFVSFLLLNFVKNAIFNSEKKNIANNFKIKNILIVGIVFLFLCGKNINKIFGITIIPYLSIIQLFLLYICIFISSKVIYKVISYFSYTLCLIYCTIALFHSIFNKYPENILTNTLNNLELILAIIIFTIIVICLVINLITFKTNKNKNINRNQNFLLSTLKNFGICIGFISIFAIPAIIYSIESISLIVNGFLSTILSFGGGDSYLPLVEGFFIENNLINEETFYNNIIPIVNILPGSILAKTLSCVGVTFCTNFSNNIFILLLFAMLGYSICISSSCFVFSLLRNIYEQINFLDSFVRLKHYIRLMISGMLLNVILSLVVQLIDKSQMFIFPYIPTLVFIISLILIMILSKTKIGHNYTYIVLTIIISIITCNLFI